MKDVCILLSMILGWGATAPAQVPSVTITPSSQQLQNDSNGYVRIRVNGVQHLHAYNIQISYNPTIVRCRSVRGLGFFAAQTFFASMIDSVNGRATINEAILGPSGQSGSGDLAELRFFCLMNGLATLSFVTADFRDTVNQVIVVTTEGALIQVGPPAAVQEISISAPNVIRLESYPNPFNPVATIRYVAKESGETIFRIYSILGNEVHFEKCYLFSPGQHEFVWNGQNQNGQDLSSGMYIGRVETGNYRGTTKLMLLR